MTSKADRHVPRVLQVVGSLGRGGAETMLVNVHRHLDRSRLQFDYLVFGAERGAYESQVQGLGGRVLRLPRRGPGGVARLIRPMASLMREAGPFAAVHAHVNFAAASVLMAARSAGIDRRIAHAHTAGHGASPPHRRLYRCAARKVLGRLATDLVACGEDAGAYVFGGEWPSRGRVIHNCIGEEWLERPSRNDRVRIRRELGAGPTDLVLGCVGRLAASKNHRFLLSVMTDLVDQAESPPLTLVVVGDGPLRRELESQVRVANLEARVRFLGQRDDVRRLMSAFDWLLLPSHYEGVPMVLLEAQAAGVPCLVSDRVSREADVGLGLIHFLPIDSTQPWAEAITGRHVAVPSYDRIAAALSGHGYLAEDVAEALSQLYRL